MTAKSAPSPWFRIVVGVGAVLILTGVVWLAVLVLGTNGPLEIAAPTPTPAPLAPATATPAQPPTATPAPLAPATAKPAQPPTAPVAPAPTATVAPAPTATPVPPREAGGPLVLSTPVHYDNDLGTRSTEFSAIALNESTNRLLIADDEGVLFEFDLMPDGLPVVPPRRMITVQVGTSDIEGLAWMSDTTYVIVHEDDGVLSVIDIADDARQIESADRVRAIETGIAEVDGGGIEGVTLHRRSEAGGSGFTDAGFVIVVEEPPSLRFIAEDGATEQAIPLGDIVADASDVWAASDGTIWLVSHLDAMLVGLEITAQGSVNERQRVPLVFGGGSFPQAEGIVMSRDGSRLYVVGEGGAPREFVFALWSAQPG